MVKTLAVEWGPSNVRINSVAPGTIIGNGMNNYPDEVRRAVFTDYAWKVSRCVNVFDIYLFVIRILVDVWVQKVKWQLLLPFYYHLVLLILMV
jgi:NAD(P)-dependent dehydrogenase (short-subunit alcohol dehydrogenase family)